MRGMFQRPTLFVDLETPPNRTYRQQLAGMGWPMPVRHIVRNQVKHRLPPGHEVGRIALIGFSESCTGVRTLLSSDDGSLIDTAIACDGIHAGFVGGEPNKERSNVDMAAMAPWLAFAILAARVEASNSADPPGQRHCVITHSSIGDQLYPPFKYASTTRTAAIILNTVFGQQWPQALLPGGIMYLDEDPAYVAPAGTLPGGQKYPRVEYPHSPDKYSVGDNGLVVLGFNNLDPTGVGDHKYQAQRVLPRVIEKLLIARWNEQDPSTGVCVAPYVAAAGAVPTPAPPGARCYNPDGVTVPPGALDGTQNFSLDWRRFVPPGSAPPGPGPEGEVQSRYAQPGFGFWQGMASVALGMFGGAVGFKIVQQLRERFGQ